MAEHEQQEQCMPKAVYKAEDGTEYATAKEAAHRDALILQAEEVKKAVDKLQRLMGDGALTADGESFDSRKCKTYWMVHEPYGSVPRIEELFLYPHSLSVDLDRGDGAIVVREYCSDRRGGGEYRTYKVSELYVSRGNAEDALIAAADKWLAEKISEVKEMKKRARSNP